jgi:hypothetical protein
MHARSPKIHPVAQEHPLGCAVACVAALAELSYEEAHHQFEETELAWTRGYYCSEVTAALRKLGYDYSYKVYDPLLHKRFLKHAGTIVFVGACKAYPSGHYLVRSENGWMNSWSNFPKMGAIDANFQEALPARVAYVIYPRRLAKLI